MSSQDLKINYIKIISSINPILPHLSSECFENLNISYEDTWPEIEKIYIKPDKITIVVQINGKKRSLIDFEYDVNEKELMKKIEKDASCIKNLDGKEILKTIFIKSRLINIITN